MSRSDYTAAPDVPVVSSFDEALAACDQQDIEQVFVIGGASVYEQALQSHLCSGVHITCVKRSSGNCLCCAASLAVTSRTQVKRFRATDSFQM